MSGASEAVRAMDGGVIDYQEVIVSSLDDLADKNYNWIVANRGEIGEEKTI